MTTRDTKLIIDKAMEQLDSAENITRQERDYLFAEHQTQEHEFKDDVMRLSVIGSAVPTFRDYDSIVSD